MEEEIRKHPFHGYLTQRTAACRIHICTREFAKSSKSIGDLFYLVKNVQKFATLQGAIKKM
jgi:hypothetical protein